MHPPFVTYLICNSLNGTVFSFYSIHISFREWLIQEFQEVFQCENAAPFCSKIQMKSIKFWVCESDIPEWKTMNLQNEDYWNI